MNNTPTHNILFEVAPVFGAVILLFLCFVVIASGIILITQKVDPQPFNGACTIIAGVLCGVAAYLVYRNYEKKTAPAPSKKSTNNKK